MDVLAAMFRAAERAGILSRFGAAEIKHRVSLYADDVVVFAKPDSVGWTPSATSSTTLARRRGSW
jgi:hypothetical protein